MLNYRLSHTITSSDKKVSINKMADVVSSSQMQCRADIFFVIYIHCRNEDTTNFSIRVCIVTFKPSVKWDDLVFLPFLSKIHRMF